jgi:hypothetical protein
MAENYKVEQGDYLSKIAGKFGFIDYKAIWDHPKNALLKQKRPSPAVLFPGDTLFIPDKKQKTQDRATDSGHTFVVEWKLVRLKVVLKDRDDNPIANADGRLSIAGAPVDLSSDGSGLIDKEIDVRQSHVGVLALKNTGRQFDVRLGIRIGHLNPVDTPSGQIARLNNLGYLAGKIATGELMDQKQAIDPKDLSRFQSAVEEFQCDHMGPAQVDGVCGKHTQSKLIEVHGC